MERDLRDVMSENLGAREQAMRGMEPPAAALARTVRTVRRRRAVRHSTQAVGGVAIVAVLAAGSWFGLRGAHEPHPAVAPTSSPTVAPSPDASTPTPSATPAPTVVPDAILGLPPTLPLPPGLLQQTTPGWVLAVYGSAEPDLGTEDFGDTLPGFLAHTVVLAAPTGELYRVVDLPPEMGLSLLTWSAGSTTAIVRVDWQGDYGQGAVPRAELDLTTGTITPRPIATTESGIDDWYFDGVAADGSEVWRTPTSTDAVTADVYSVAADGTGRRLGAMGRTMLLDPTGRRGVTPPDSSTTTFDLVDLVAGGTTHHDYGVAGKACDVVGWLDPDALLAMCVTSGFDRWADQPSGVSDAQDWASADPGMYRIDIGAHRSSLLAPLTQSEPLAYTWEGAWVRSGEVAYPAGQPYLRVRDCDDAVFSWSGDGQTLVQGPGDSSDNYLSATTAGDRLFVASSPGCAGDAAPLKLTVHSLTSGESTVLLPAPPLTPAVQKWASGVESWVVGR
ncbi:hypothetical protein ACPPVS_18980 [Cellulomonas sp. McL0617]|uniref:hypothetical protein n=1 Tax=Cellulomonas sp. McL0617 TaxID=3415675 RepID=UPI003CF58BD4